MYKNLYKKSVKLTIIQIQNLMVGTGQQGRLVGHREGRFFIYTPGDWKDAGHSMW